MKISTILLLIISLSACASVYRSSDLKSIDNKKIVIIETKEKSLINNFFIYTIDEQRLGFGIFHRYELAPGVHSIRAICNVGRYCEKSLVKKFNGIAGRKYKIIYIEKWMGPTQGIWTFNIIDTDTNQDVSY
jgi:hypothetical protein